jgi:hypothetical protein
MAKTARTGELPGMEDRAIADLEQMALDYADIRDRRQALNREEVDLKQKTMALMHKHHKTEYRRDGIEIRIVPGEEDVKVKVKPETEKDEDDEASDS